MDADETGKSFDTEGLSELSLGIREVFRILIPGAYAVVVWEWIHGDLAESLAGQSKLAMLIISVVAGLLAYGLQVHEKWIPWNLFFRHHRIELNSAITRAAGVSVDKDYVSEYKYFLETRASAMKDRIHYFSSFYYMLTEMSLISMLGGIGILYCLFRALVSSPALLLYPLIAAALIQLTVLYWDPMSTLRDKKKRSHDGAKVTAWIVSGAPVLLVAVWIVLNFGAAIYRHAIWPTGPLMRPDWRFWGLLMAAVVFERLGTKQWKSVINEQVALVNGRNAEVKDVIIAATNGRTERATTS